MLILFEHVEYFKWEAKNDSEQRKVFMYEANNGSLGDSLVAFINVEADDTTNIKTRNRAVKMINKLAAELKVANVVLYPFAHLKPDGHAEEETAIEVLAGIESGLMHLRAAYSIVSVPFGCSKMREAKVLGHQRAVLLRSVK